MPPKKTTKKIKEPQAHEISNRTNFELAIPEPPKPEPPRLTTNVKHLANLGDIIAIMPSLKRFYEITGRKICLLQQVNHLAAYYQGAVHPTVNEDGQNVSVNQPMFDMMKPLVESQEYIDSMVRYEGQRVDLDFDVIRGKTFVNMPNGLIHIWTMLAFPDLACDLSKPWITLDGECPPHIKEQVRGKIILNFTERYRNALIDYFFLKNYAPSLIFTGTENEHWLFCNKWGLSIPYLKVNNFLELAYAIKESKFIFANQSFNWGIAEAIKKPRILEMCSFAPNCMPCVGENSYGFFHQVGAEYYFKRLFNETFHQ